MTRSNDWWPDFPVIQGFGSTHEMRDKDDGDPRNPRLIGMKSVSYAGAVGLAKPKPKEPRARRVGFLARRP